MSGLIDRQAAINAIKNIDTSIIPWKKAKEYADETKAYAIMKIEDLPDAEQTANVLYGRTFYTDDGQRVVDPRIVCGNCGATAWDYKGNFNYCPKCGRKLIWRD